jgi:monoamine oxidase
MSRSLFRRLHSIYGTRPSRARQREKLQQRIDDLSRRKLLGPRRPPRKRAGTVVVVGAGFAGLSAARLLTSRFKVIVLEARARVGGRVLSRRSGGSTIEAGGELIGYIHPMWLSLANQYELGMSVITAEANFVAMRLDSPLILGGESLGSVEAEELYQEMNHVLSAMSGDAAKVDPYHPWRAGRAREWDALSMSQWIERRRCKPRVKLALEAQFANNNGTAAAQQSYLANLALVAAGSLQGESLDYFEDVETVRCGMGNQALALRMAQEIRDSGGSIRLSTPVTGIRLGERGVQVQLDGERINAEQIILAVPPSVWSKIDINPPIPESLRPRMGTAIKYLSKVQSRFWLKNDLSPSAMSDEFGLTWEGTDNQIGKKTPELSLFAGGPAADRALLAKRQGRVADHFDTLLDRALPGYSQSRKESPSLISWPTTRWTLGGYSSPAPGQVTAIGPLLETPFGERLHFAGEHAMIAYFGYMEGALQSGARVATRVLES